MQVEIEYGDGHLSVEVPDDTVVVAADRTDHEPPPLADPVAGDPGRARRTARLRPDPGPGRPGPTRHDRLPRPGQGRPARHGAPSRGAAPAPRRPRAGRRRRRGHPARVRDRAAPQEPLGGVRGLPRRRDHVPAPPREHRQPRRRGPRRDDRPRRLLARRPRAGQPRGHRERPRDHDRSHRRQPLRRLQRRLQDAGHRADRAGARSPRTTPRAASTATTSCPSRPAAGSATSSRAIGQRMEEEMPQPFFTVDAVLDSQVAPARRLRRADPRRGAGVVAAGHGPHRPRWSTARPPTSCSSASRATSTTDRAWAPTRS